MMSSIYASLLALMLMALSLNVIKARRHYQIGVGDADNIELKRKIGAQTNLAQYAPIFLILLGYAEYNGLPHWAIHVLGLTFLFGRFMHAFSVLKVEQYDNHKLLAMPVWRRRGMKLTFNTIGVLAIIVLVQCVLAMI